jgi:hypothetical protein
MTVSTTLNDQRGLFKATITGVASTDNAGIGEIANPEGVTLGITRAFLYFRDGSTGAANLDIGVGASGAKASDIVSALAVVDATVGGKFYYAPAAQAAETESPTALWTSGTYVTLTGSATTAGLDADLYIEYIRLA